MRSGYAAGREHRVKGPESAAGPISANHTGGTPLLRLRPTVGGGEAGLGQCVGVDHVAGERRGGVGGNLEPFDLQGVHGEDVAVRLVARWWARPAPAGDPVVDAHVAGT